MNKDVEKALDALVTIKKFCSFRSCTSDKCPFFCADKESEKCVFLQDAPYLWKEIFIPEYSNSEMSLVKGFLANEYKTIKRHDDGVIFCANGKQDVYFPTNSFKSLPKYTQIKLEDFVRLGEKYGK